MRGGRGNSGGGRWASRSSRRQWDVRPVFVSVGVATVCALLWSSVAAAGSANGSDGGNHVTVGASGSSSAGPSPGAGAAGDGGGSGVACTLTSLTPDDYASFDLQPGGDTPGAWDFVSCGDSAEDPGGSGGVLRWIPAPTGPAATAVPAAPGTPAMVVAARAASSIDLPTPTIELNPVGFSVVNVATWLAVDRSLWRPWTASASAGGVTARAVATPTSVTWTMGDGHSVRCDTPGQVFDPDLPAGEQSSTCQYTYATSSAGLPSADGDPDDAAFTITATISWAVTWTAVGAAGGGTLPPLETRSSVSRRVEQVESVGVGG